MRGVTKMSGSPDSWVLSQRQLQALQLIADGRTVQQAAADMGVQYATMLDYMEVVRAKLEAKTTAHAVALGLRSNIIG